MRRWREHGDLYGRLNEGTMEDSLLKIEERETDAVLDENSEVLSFHHDRPVDENGDSALQKREDRAFLRNIFCGCLLKGDIL